MAEEKNTDEKIFLTPEQALDLIVDGDYVHTYINPTGGIMVGADHSRESLIEQFKKYKDSIEISGPMARGTKHGVVIVKGGGSNLFVETDETKLNAFDPIE